MGRSNYSIVPQVMGSFLVFSSYFIDAVRIIFYTDFVLQLRSFVTVHFELGIDPKLPHLYVVRLFTSFFRSSAEESFKFI